MDGQPSWACSLHRPSTNTRGAKLYETGQQIPLDIRQCIKAISLAKTQDQHLPLVLRFFGEHYSAYVHTRGAGDWATLANRRSPHAVVTITSALGTGRPMQHGLAQQSKEGRPTPAFLDHQDYNIMAYQLALVPTCRDISAQPVAQKRAHSTTPAEREQIRQIMRTRVDVHEAGGDAVMQDTTRGNFQAIPRPLERVGRSFG